MKLKHFIPMLLLAFVVNSCAVLSTVPRKNAARSVMVTDTDQRTSDMYLRMITGIRTYTPYESEYRTISASIDSLISIYTYLPKAQDYLKLATTIKQKFDSAQTYHARKNILTTGEAIVYQDYFKRFWKPLRVAELRLK